MDRLNRNVYTECSVGEQQLIGWIRMFLQFKDAKICVIDDATSDMSHEMKARVLGIWREYMYAQVTTIWFTNCTQILGLCDQYGTIQNSKFTMNMCV